MLTCIRMMAENSTGRLVEILGADGARRYEELQLEPLMDEYSISVSEAPISATQKQELAGTLMTMADRMAASGVNIYPVVVEYLPGLRLKDKQKLLEAMQPNPPSPEQEQQQQLIAQTALEGQRARTLKDISDARLKDAQAIKTQAETTTEFVDADAKRADVVKTLADAEQKNTETSLMQANAIAGGGVEVII